MIKSDLFWSETHADRAPLFCNGLWPVLAWHVGRCHVTISTSHDWRPIASTYKNHGWKIRFYGHLYFAGVRNLALKLYSNSIWIILKISCFTITEQRRSVTMGSWPTKSHLIILALVRERDEIQNTWFQAYHSPPEYRAPPVDRGIPRPFRAFCVDGLPQITSYWCNYIKLAEIGNRADPAIGKRDGHTRTDRRTDEQTSNSGDPLHKRP